MPVRKLSVALDEATASAAAAAARRLGMSLSAWLNAAAIQALAIGDGLAAMDEWEREHGAFTDAEIAAADHRLDSLLHGRGPAHNQPVRYVQKRRRAGIGRVAESTPGRRRP